MDKSNSDKTSIIDFPCDFSLKIIGENAPNFIKNISAIVKKHYPDTIKMDISHKSSQHNKYISITANVYAKDQATLDELYKELTQYPGIKMVL